MECLLVLTTLGLPFAVGRLAAGSHCECGGVGLSLYNGTSASLGCAESRCLFLGPPRRGWAHVCFSLRSGRGVGRSSFGCLSVAADLSQSCRDEPGVGTICFCDGELCNRLWIYKHLRQILLMLGLFSFSAVMACVASRLFDDSLTQEAKSQHTPRSPTRMLSTSAL